MIFEVPIDHFPAQQQISRTAGRSPMRLVMPSAVQSKEVSTAIAPQSPSVRRTQFTFQQHSTRSDRNLNTTTRTRMMPPPLKRAFTSPSLPVQHLNLNNLRKGSAPGSEGSRNNSVCDLLKNDLFRMPSVLLSSAASLHQLA